MTFLIRPRTEDRRKQLQSVFGKSAVALSEALSQLGETVPIPEDYPCDEDFRNAQMKHEYRMHMIRTVELQMVRATQNLNDLVLTPPKVIK